MKRLSANQLRLIVVLNFVIIALLVGLFWALPFFEPQAAVGGKVYSRSRVGEISLNPHLGWELELLGSNKEEVVSSFEFNQTLYVFGNSLSSDLDFDRPCIFLAAIDVFGKLNEDSIFYYGQEGDVLADVIASNDGFLLAVEGVGAPYVLMVGLDGLVAKRVDTVVNTFEMVDSIVAYDYGFLLFTRPYNQTKKTFGLRCIFFDKQMSFKLSSFAQSEYSLEPFEVVLFSSVVKVICNASSAFFAEFAAIVEFSVSDSAVVLVAEEARGRIFGFSVYKGDFLLLNNLDGASFVRLSMNFEVVLLQQVSNSTPLYFTDLGGGFYVVCCTSASYVFNENLVRVATLESFSPFSTLYFPDSVIFGVVAESRVCVVVFFDGVMIDRLVIFEGKSPILTSGESGLYLTFIKDGNAVVCTLRV